MMIQGVAPQVVASRMPEEWQWLEARADLYVKACREEGLDPMRPHQAFSASNKYASLLTYVDAMADAAAKRIASLAEGV